MFDQTVPPFQKALSESGYSHTLEYEPSINQTKPGKRNRSRKIIWFVPPYSSNVTTRVGSKILSLLDSSFPPSNPLHEIFNRNTVKVSYRTAPNMKQVITGHNKKVQAGHIASSQTKPCTCTAEPCPVQSKCKQEGVVYQALVTHKNAQTNQDVRNTYLGMTANTFYERHQNHKSSFKHKSKEYDSELSKHIWQLKEKGLSYTITWKI